MDLCKLENVTYLVVQQFKPVIVFCRSADGAEKNHNAPRFFRILSLRKRVYSSSSSGGGPFRGLLCIMPLPL